MIGSVQTLGIYREEGTVTPHWSVSHSSLSAYGDRLALPITSSIVTLGPNLDEADGKRIVGNDADEFVSVPVVFQGGFLDEYSGFYTLSDRAYDPLKGRWVNDGGGTNGYAFSENAPDRNRVSLPDGDSGSFLQDYLPQGGLPTGPAGTGSLLVQAAFNPSLLFTGGVLAPGESKEDGIARITNEIGQLERTLELARLSAASYDNSAVPGWQGLATVDGGKGFRARLFKNPKTGEHIISFAGTDPLDIPGDILTDGAQAFGFDTTQYNEALTTTNQWIAQFDIPRDQLRLTGHSLGGGLASAVSILRWPSPLKLDQLI